MPNGITADLIVANLPYIDSATTDTLAVTKWEPRLALDGGDDGLMLIRELLQQAPHYLQHNGNMLLEIGADQGPFFRVIKMQHPLLQRFFKTCLNVIESSAFNCRSQNMSIILPADDPNSVHVAIEMLNHSKLIVIPTDTGYGLAAPLSDEAILRSVFGERTTACQKHSGVN